MLITNAEKSKGAILVKAGVNPQRRRFTVGHELGHYLLPWHRQTTFQCTSEDIKDRDEPSRMRTRASIETEANSFASELLMPRAEVKKRLLAFGEPDLDHVRKMSDVFDASIEATAWRYKTVSDYSVALVFSHRNTVRYWTRGPEFPYLLDVRKGVPLPNYSPSRADGDGLSEWAEVDSALWLSEEHGSSQPDTILEQTLHQKDGYKVTLLYVESIPDEDN